MLNKEKRLNISLNAETLELLIKEKEKLAESLGFVPSYSQLLQHLIKSAQIKTQS